MSRGARQGKIPAVITQQVERIKEKLKIPVVVYDVEHKPTTEFIRNTQDTTEFIRNTKPTTEFIKETKPTTEFIRETKPTTEFIREEKKTTEFIRETKPTTEFIVETKPTTKYDVTVEKTTKYDVKHEPLELEKIVQKALDAIIEKNKITVDKMNYRKVDIDVFKMIFTCPHCKEKFSLGGLTK